QMSFMRSKDSYPPRRTGFNSRLRYTIPSISGGIFLIMDEFVVYARSEERRVGKEVGSSWELFNWFKSHNHYSTKGYTVRFRPWEVVYVEFFTTKDEAMVRDRCLKGGVGRELLLANVIYEE